MGNFAIIKKLIQIDNECKKNDELRKMLEPWVEKMNKIKPTKKSEALNAAQKLIDEYERLKQEITADINTCCADGGGIRKIDKINEV
jgi:hypothetical protein